MTNFHWDCCLTAIFKLKWASVLLEQLLHLIEASNIDPTRIISHTMKLDEGPKGYETFDKKEDVTKIVLKP
jgi:S-(hydroxymethyl)glutathione dehydrogenase/alcohol dehydrogenase